LDALLQTYRRNLQIIERQIAAQGGVDQAPIRLINEADDARHSIADLERQVTLLGGTLEADAPSPYPGLMAFGREQASSFYGRAGESADLLALVRSTPIVMVVGASGSGKSSLVVAGLLPLLDRPWRVLCLAHGARPLRALADQLATLVPPETRMRL